MYFNFLPSSDKNNVCTPAYWKNSANTTLQNLGPGSIASANAPNLSMTHSILLVEVFLSSVWHNDFKIGT